MVFETITLGCGAVVVVSGPEAGLSGFPGSPGAESGSSSSRHSLKELQEQPAFTRLSHFTGGD